MTVSSLWRNRDFVKLWTGQTISEIGSRITREGVPITAALVLHSSPLAMGVLAAVGGIAILLCGPFAGLVADRFRLRPILIGTDLGRACVIGLIPFLAWRGALTIEALCVVIGIAGVLGVFFDVSYQTLMPSLVGREDLHEGNAKLSLGAATAETIGPALAGMLIQALTAPIAMMLDAGSFVISAISVALIKKPEIAKGKHDEFPSVAEITSGLRFTFGHPILRPLALRALTNGLFWGFFAALYVLWAVQYLKFTPWILGLVVTLGGISNWFGSMLAPWIHRRFATGTILIGSTVLPGLAGLLLPLPSGPGWFAIACMGGAQLLGDIAFPVFNIQELTLRQSIAPPELLGRVNSAMQMMFRGILPIGALLGGALGQFVGVRATIVMCAVGVLMSSLWLIFSPVRGLREVPAYSQATNLVN